MTMYVSWLGGTQYGVAKEPISTSTVSTSTMSAKTAAAPAGASIAVIFSTNALYVNTGPEATVTAAANNSMYVPANTERHLAINPGNAVAAVRLA